MHNEPPAPVDIIIDDAIAAIFHAPDGLPQAAIAACQVAGIAGIPHLCIRFAPDEEIRQLNHQWRGLDKVTDVLSFPMQEADHIDITESLGDIALAVPFVQQEAKRLELEPDAHLCHLVVHSTLHLLGYDHIDDEQALEMQQLERLAMQQLQLHDPYPELTA